jgi:hypothetical protein
MVHKKKDLGIPISKTKNAYKLLSIKKTEGGLYPLFIDKKSSIPIGEWIKAKSLPTDGFRLRSGWHSCMEPNAPHLTEKNRKWFRVEICNYKEFDRPDAQGKKWYVSEWIKILKPV